jgi:hypothetical protein
VNGDQGSVCTEDCSVPSPPQPPFNTDGCEFSCDVIGIGNHG